MTALDHLGARLCWSRRGGLARSSSNATARLQSPPELPFKFAELDYCPAMGHMRVRDSDHDSERDLLPSEIAACKAFLFRMDDVPDLEPDA